MLIVEKAIVQDLESVSDLDALAFGPPPRPDTLRSAIDYGTCWVARQVDRIVGFARVDSFLHGHGFLGVIAVHPDHRRQGIATALVNRLEAACPTDRLFTAIDLSNVAMHRLGEALGFVRSGQVEELDEGHTELIYVKRLESTR
jgi:ribosomal protein S18 acetylase RimI-like enzyme